MFLTRLLVASALAMFSCAFAQGISYTVQVVALSDQESALSVQRTLLDDAFPTYVVRASVAQGDIYRVRVGSFANRLAASEYAQAMPDVAGSRPLPALSEGIPEGIMPVEPRLLLSYVPRSNEQDAEQGVSEQPANETDANETNANEADAEEAEAEEGDAADGEPEESEPEDADPVDDDQDDVDQDEVDEGDFDAGEIEPAENEPAGSVSGIEPGEAQPVDTAEPVDVALIAWADTFGLRIQPEPGVPATYVVPSVAGVRTFEAWRAAPTDAGILRVRNLLLWSEEWQEQSIEAREEHRLELINRIARRVGAGPAQIELLQRRPVFGPPYLVVLELAGDGGSEATVLGVTSPDGEPTAHGPDAVSVGDGDYPESNEPLFVVSPGTTGPDEGVEGEGWSVTPDERFFQVVAGPGQSSWRAGLGRPLWAAGSHLLTRDGDRLLLYELISE